MNPTYDFTGKVALVTGASSGMGLATAQAFAESGAAVVLADINDEFLQAATAGLRARGHQVLGGSAIQRDWPTRQGTLRQPDRLTDIESPHRTES
jgi:NAD(P)-dependent dehydrogenase (short-subunit alcohol dehydrogenase family)